jgi:hydroxypyruvate reductase
MLHANNQPNVFALACDTDGIDGSEDNAGAVIAASDLALALRKDHRPDQYLNNNDAYSFFESINALIKTGPTRTNVNDFRAILITEDK